ncbi:MAG: prepilin-type N-terminal cleavage/methylation domain-containing protein [Armatimonadetes bacterium]|nr:prepilin-type N-terminal cleavage/methylation domain-containing protein [Armatimonadota bacterium]
MSPRRGFSLLETVVAGSLLALVMLLLFNLFPSSMLALRQGEQQIQADAVAQSALDQVRSEGYGKLQPGEVRRLQPVRRGSLVYTPTLEVFQVADADPNLLKGLRTTVSWQERGESRQVVHEIWIHGLAR